MKDYTTPSITEIGSLHELTLAPGNNKIGGTPDIFSNITGIVGSIVPQQPR